MKTIRHLVTAALLAASTAAAAMPVYVDQWNLSDGTYWRQGAPVLSGQQAAALLFGGSAGDYLISTVGPNAADINRMAWYDQYGYVPATFAQDYVSDDGQPGLYDSASDASALVNDHLYRGAGAYPYVNYAFRVEAGGAVPEPLSVGLMGAGLLGLALARRRWR